MLLSANDELTGGATLFPAVCQQIAVFGISVGKNSVVRSFRKFFFKPLGSRCKYSTRLFYFLSDYFLFFPVENSNNSACLRASVM